MTTLRLLLVVGGGIALASFLLAASFPQASSSGWEGRATTGASPAPVVDPGGTGRASRPDSPRRATYADYQIVYCARGMCAGPERWAWRSRLNHERAERLAGRVAELERRLDARTVQVHKPETDWRAKQIAAAEVIARESGGDPWPNCPDPYDHAGHSWDDLVACENGGSWLDSPGFYRCGGQFHPMWEDRFGRLCP